MTNGWKNVVMMADLNSFWDIVAMKKKTDYKGGLDNITYISIFVGCIVSDATIHTWSVLQSISPKWSHWTHGRACIHKQDVNLIWPPPDILVLQHGYHTIILRPQ